MYCLLTRCQKTYEDVVGFNEASSLQLVGRTNEMCAARLSRGDRGRADAA